MTLKTTKLRDAIMFALAVSATSLAGTGLAFAQSTTPAQTPATTNQQATDLDTIVVTGSRIQSQTVTASSPVTEIQQEEFQYAGVTRTEDLVNQYPQMSPAFDSFNNNPSLGYPTVNLRGLGAGRTLTLVNGKRLAPGAAEAADISIVPSFMVQRVDILTGGASAVYGSDAVAGVVNFILDTEFEGVKMSVGTSAYRHKNDNEYIQGKLSARSFPFPSGDSGFDGKSQNVDVAAGSSFADGRGHAMAWMTWRKNDELFQGERDYSSCALSAAGTACGGSATNAAGNFYFYQGGSGSGSSASLRPDGTYLNAYGAPYNYAPINYYQRPDERYTFGSSVKFEVNEHFKPYLETMFINKKDALQIAPSGAFFTSLSGINCTNPLIGTACRDLGFDPADGPLTVYVAKRNVEGGPRRSQTDTTQFRIVGGVEGKIDEAADWTYNAYYLYGQTNADNVGANDFLTPRIRSALLGCPAGSFAGCIPYRVFVPNGVTPEAARALAGTSLNVTKTETASLTAYITGTTGYGLPWASGENVSLAVGGVRTSDKYSFTADSDSQAGNFAGAGGPARPVSGKITVNELFGEANVPVVRGAGFLKTFDLDLGYRLSRYNLAGTAETFKVGFTADMGFIKPRGGYNRAIRAPGINNLFAQQQIALFNGVDPCAGATPRFTAAQCVNLGVPTNRYGLIAANPANQYNQFIGGNLELAPEKADTYTLGFVVTPMDDLRVSVDYYDIAIEDTISTIGAQTILDQCGLTGDAVLCAQIRRNPLGGDLFRGNDPATSGLVRNLTGNFGEISFRGIDLSAFYGWDMLGGRFSTSFQGNYLLEQEIAPLAPASASATYDCAGKINVQCQSPEWRHIASLRYSREWGSVNLRWRYFGEMDYVDRLTEQPLSTDKLLCSTSGGTTAAFASCLGDGTLKAYNYIDLSGSLAVGSWGELTVGVNNIADKEPPLVGSTQALNGNAPGGYDQAGRFFFTSFTMRF
ncbi:MAG: TonB-dependent receptor plug domain-containing protein [Pseudomonadota bacterium]